VGIGEHLGYLFTGVWTLFVAASILSTAVLPGWLDIVALPIGVALLMARSSSSAPTSVKAGHWRARSCRLPTSRGRSG
jgi:hypothetical protein